MVQLMFSTDHISPFQAAEAGSGALREEAEAAAAAVLERVFDKSDFRRMEVCAMSETKFVFHTQLGCIA